MRLVDLSRELYHRTPAHPSHPPVVMTVWNDHDEIKRAGNTTFTSKALYLSLSDHAGSHVDAPCHFNPAPDAASIDHVPLEDFYTEAVCLDLSQVALKHQITVWLPALLLSFSAFSNCFSIHRVSSDRKIYLFRKQVLQGCHMRIY